MSRIIIPIGISGSGKTAHYFNHYSSYKRISADAIRFKMLNSYETKIYFDKERESSVWARAFRYLEKALVRNENVYFDATNLVYHDREKLYAMIPHDYEIVVIYFKISLKLALENNRKRKNRTIDEDIINKQFNRIEKPNIEEIKKCSSFQMVIDNFQKIPTSLKNQR